MLLGDEFIEDILDYACLRKKKYDILLNCFNICLNPNSINYYKKKPIKATRKDQEDSCGITIEDEKGVIKKEVIKGHKNNNLLWNDIQIQGNTKGIVIGWKLTQKNGDNGYWDRVSDPMTGSFDFQFHAQLFCGCHWYLTYYYIENENDE